MSDRAPQPTIDDPSAGAEVMLEVTGLTVEFSKNGRPVRIVDGVDLAVRRGEIVGVVGESGSGKSLTMLGILNLVPSPGRVAAGSVEFLGRSLLELSPKQLAGVRGAQLALVPSDAGAVLNPVVRVGRQVDESLRSHRPELRSAERSRLVVELLGRAGLNDPERQARLYPHEMSGGMQQRVVVAIGIATNPMVLIADEPTTALDVTIQAQILKLLLDLRAELDMSMLFVTHEITTVSEICDRVFVMYAGEIVEKGSAYDVCTAPAHPYTAALLASIPPLGGEVPESLATIPGAPPDPADWPIGCRFAERCHLRPQLDDDSRCRSERPLLQPVGNGQSVACHFTERMVEATR